MLLVAPAGSPVRASEMGIRLGIEEAERAALLFGGSVTLASFSGDARDPETAGNLESTVRRTQTTALFGGDDAPGCAALSRSADRLGVLYFNVSSSDDALRGAECRRTTFHVMPSAAMLRDARARADVAVESDARSVAWDESLERFGADSLNQRFQGRYGRPMTDEAWTGWLAVKVLWESALRARTSDPGAIADALASESMRFDGHKGRTLSFRRWDHQLRQPVYVVTRGSGAPRIVEVPTAALDELGVSAEQTTCRWQR